MPQIIPIKDLKNTVQISELCHASEEPIYITKNGYGDMVIMSMETFEFNMQKQQLYNDLEISEHQMESGDIKDARESLRAIRSRYDL